MNTSATTIVSRMAASATAFTAGKAVKKGTASNEVTPITGTADKPMGIGNETLTIADTTASATVNGANQGVIVSGPTMALAGATIAVDDHVVVDATGALVVKSAAGYVVGQALTAAASGEYFQILVNIRKEPA